MPPPATKHSTNYPATHFGRNPPPSTIQSCHWKRRGLEPVPDPKGQQDSSLSETSPQQAGRSKLAEKRGGLNGSMQHWLGVFSPESQNPKSFVGVDLSAALRMGDTQCLEPGAFDHRQRWRSSRREALWHGYQMPPSGEVTISAEGGLTFQTTINGKGPFKTLFDTGR
jgi:hypothetical protein